MKGFLALLFIALLALTAFNWWQIQSLREEVASLQAKVNGQQSASLTNDAIAQATVALAQAREALQKTDPARARAAFDEARQKLDTALRGASDKAAPTVKWLQGQASDLGRQLQDKVRANH